MYQASTSASADRDRNAQREMAQRLYRDIGISAVAAALEVARPAPRASRISAWKVLDMQRETQAAA